jgi:hypothetical protein
MAYLMSWHQWNLKTLVIRYFQNRTGIFEGPKFLAFQVPRTRESNYNHIFRIRITLIVDHRDNNNY